MSLGAILKGATTVIGMLQQRKKDPRMAAAERAAEEQAALSRKLMGMADAYDPAAETKASVDYARRVAEGTLRNTMRGVTADFKNAGGIVGGDTAFLHTQQQAADSVLNPLSEFAAKQRATDFQRKLMAYQTAASTAPPGQLPSMFSNLAGSGGKDLTSLLSMGQSALGDLLPSGAGRIPAANQGAGPGQTVNVPGQIGPMPSVLRSGKPSRAAMLATAKRGVGK